MGKTKIEWADHTINPIIGCSKCSPGCDNCYAERMAARLAMNPAAAARYSNVISAGKWNGTVDVSYACFSGLPNKPSRIFVGSMGDTFHESLEQAHFDELFNIISNLPQHTFMLLTKRPQRMHDMIANLGKRWITNVFDPQTIAAYPRKIPTWPLQNVWLGVTVENQEMAYSRIPPLLATPAAKRFVSIEPMLGKINFRWEPLFSMASGESYRQYLLRKGSVGEYESLDGIDWVIVGGESGPKARPVHPEWVQSVRDQCQEAGVSFFFKQWGEWWPIHDTGKLTWDELSCGADEKPARPFVWLGLDGETSLSGGEPDALMLRMGKAEAGCVLDGREWKEFPNAKTGDDNE